MPVDPYSLDVDQTVVRSILAKRNLKKFPFLKQRSNLTKCDSRKEAKRTQECRLKLKDVRSQRELKRPLPAPVRAMIANMQPIEYNPTIGKARIKKEEKNPFDLPPESLTHNFRRTIGVFKKVQREKQLTLPSTTGASSKKIRVKTLMDNILTETLPKVDHIDPRIPTTFTFDNLTPNKYKEIWKEIGINQFIKELRETDIKELDRDINKRNNELTKFRESFLSSAAALQNAIDEEDRTLIEVQQVLVSEREKTRAKISELDDVIDQNVTLKINILNLTGHFQELHHYSCFLNAAKPHDGVNVSRVALNTCFDSLTIESSLFDDLDEFKRILDTEIPEPTLYIKNGDELENEFKIMEEMSLALWSTTVEFDKKVVEIRKTVDALICEIQKELHILEAEKSLLEEHTVDEITRTNRYKNKCKNYVFGVFKNEFMREQCLMDKIAPIYEEAIRVDATNLSSVEMFKALQLYAYELMDAAENFDTKTMKFIKRMKKQEMQAIIVEQEQAKRHREFEQMLRCLLRSMRFEIVPKGRRLVWRSRPPKERKDTIPAAPPPTQEELDFQYFFT